MKILSKFRRKAILRNLAILSVVLSLGGVCATRAIKGAEKNAKQAALNIENDSKKLAEQYELTPEQVNEVKEVLEDIASSKTTEVELLQTAENMKNAGRGRAARWILDWRNRGHIVKQFPELDKGQAKLLVDQYRKVDQENRRSSNSSEGR